MSIAPPRVIDQQQFLVAEGLRRQAGDGGTQGLRRVPEGEERGDRGHGAKVGAVNDPRVHGTADRMIRPQRGGSPGPEGRPDTRPPGNPVLPIS